MKHLEPSISASFSLGCVLLSVHQFLIVSSSSVSDMFRMVLRSGEIPMIETSRVSTLIRSYLIDVGDFSLICPFRVRLFLTKHILDLLSCDDRVLMKRVSLGCV